MTINGITVNINAASSLLTSYLIEVEKIAKKVSLSVEDVDMIIRLNRKNLRFQEVVQIGKTTEAAAVNEVKENRSVNTSTKKGFKPINAICKQEIKNNTLNLAQFIFKDIIQKIDVSKVVCVDNVYTDKGDVFEYAMNLLRENGVKEIHFRFANKVSEEIREIAAKFSDNTMKVVEAEKSARESYQPQTQASMPEEPKKGRYMSAANMESLDASAPARAFNKDAIKAFAQRLAASRANKPATAPAQAPTSAPASAPEQAPAPVEATVVEQSSFVVPSFDEMMGFCSTVSTYVEKDGEMVADDGKDNEELTDDQREELLAGVSLNGYSEETPKKIEDIPEMDAGEFEREYDKMLKCIEKGNVPTPYQEALLKEFEENRDTGFMRVEEGKDYTYMISARTR